MNMYMSFRKVFETIGTKTQTHCHIQNRKHSHMYTTRRCRRCRESNPSPNNNSDSQCIVGHYDNMRISSLYKFHVLYDASKW